MNKNRQEIEGWKYYNHAVIPTTAPHEEPNMKPLKNGEIWNISGGTPLFARYSTEWDCKEETEWWYVIKDSPFDIDELKSNRRHKIYKGAKNFNVYKINYIDYANEICEIAFEVWKSYPDKYKPKINKEQFIKEILNWKDAIVYGAFDISNNKLCGYVLLREHSNYIDLEQQKVMTAYERKNINFALIYQFLIDYNSKLNKTFYICDGSRNVVHETNFQDFLEKYFGFRKAYCKLSIKYRFPIGIVIRIIKPFRKLMNLSSSLGSKIQSVLLMDDIAYKCKR